MPIRTLPLAQISEATLRDMIAREIREDRTLDFKQQLRLDDPGKLDLLADVTAMANASGGAILYGAVEGEGEQRGQIVDLAAMPIAPDQTALAISNLLRDGIDEPILNVEHREIPLDGGGYAYVIRIPASHLAPHMVTKRSHRDRFFARATVSNDPMNARQIKELSMRAASAFERAADTINARRSALDAEVTRRYTAQTREPREWVIQSALLLHFIPLYPPVDGYELADSQIADRLEQLGPYSAFAGHGSSNWSLEGLYREDTSRGERTRWTLFLRGGGLEFGMTPLAKVNEHNVSEGFVHPKSHEHWMLQAMLQAEQLSSDGLLPLPVAASLHLRFVRNVYFVDDYQSSFDIARQHGRYQDVTVQPLLISRWGDEGRSAMRRIFDTVWQSWGARRSPFYDDHGARLPGA